MPPWWARASSRTAKTSCAQNAPSRRCHKKLRSQRKRLERIGQRVKQLYLRCIIFGNNVGILNLTFESFQNGKGHAAVVFSYVL